MRSHINNYNYVFLLKIYPQLKSLEIISSPLTSPLKEVLIFDQFMSFTFSVISSPVSPSPLVKAFIGLPFLKNIEEDPPSNFFSTTTGFENLSNHSDISSFEYVFDNDNILLRCLLLLFPYYAGY